MKKFFLLICIFMLLGTADAKEAQKHKFYEKDYQRVWCLKNNGVLEYRLPDKARVDCVTQTHAIEFDFAPKWAESIGQSLYYGQQLNKIPGIVLITENKKRDIIYLKRVNSLAQNLGITVWQISPEDIQASE